MVTPLVLKIKSLPNGFDVAKPMNAERGSTTILLTVILKGDISKVSYQYQAYGYWQPLFPTSIESDKDTHQVTITFSARAETLPERYDYVDSRAVQLYAGNDKEGRRDGRRPL